MQRNNMNQSLIGPYLLLMGPFSIIDKDLLGKHKTTDKSIIWCSQYVFLISGTHVAASNVRSNNWNGSWDRLSIALAGRDSVQLVLCGAPLRYQWEQNGWCMVYALDHKKFVI